MSFSKMSFPRAATFALLLCATILPTAAVNATVQAEGGLRLRSGTSTLSDSITTLPNGATIDVVADAGDGWYQVSYEGNTGYSASEYIVLPENTELPTAEATVTEAAPEAPAPIYIQVVEGPLNIRSGAGTSFDKVGSLYVGATAQVLSSADGWYEIADGFVSGDFVTEVDIDTINANQTLGQEIANYALQYVGCSYVYGGTSPKGFDCSGFVQYVFKNFGISLNRTSSAQLSNGTPVSISELQAGDAVYFSKSSNGSVSHTGIYIGNGQFVHASTYGVGVIVSDLDYAYYTTGFVGGRRMI